MPIHQLVRFLSPVLLKDLPLKAAGGYSKHGWALKVSMAEAEGMLESPGHGPYWQCTDKGAAVCIEWQILQMVPRETEAA